MSQAAEAFLAQVFGASNGVKLPYRLLMPARYRADRHYPLVVYLHGAPQDGVDNLNQLANGVGELFTNDQNRLRYPAFVLAPQCPPGEAWVHHRTDQTDHVFQAKPTAAMAAVIELLSALGASLHIDEGRRYAMGIGTGGFGVYDLLARFPGWFIGAATFAGGGDPQQAKAYAETLIWAFHGGQDRKITPANSKLVIDAARAAGGDARLTTSVECEHDCWTKVFNNDEMLNWLFTCRLRTTMVHRRNPGGASA